jgi:hypothetical protein
VYFIWSVVKLTCCIRLSCPLHYFLFTFIFALFLPISIAGPSQNQNDFFHYKPFQAKIDFLYSKPFQAMAVVHKFPQVIAGCQGAS